MAALNDTTLNSSLKGLIASLLWEWIESHGDEEVKLKIWIIHRTFKISQLHKVFEILLGPKPA